MHHLHPLASLCARTLHALSEDERSAALSGMDRLSHALQDRAVAAFFASPLAKTGQKLGVLQRSGLPGYEALSPYLEYAIEEDGLSSWPLLHETIVHELDRSDGIARAIAETAHPLSAAQRGELEARIASITGAREVVMHERLSPDKLSGFTLRVGDLVIEGSFSSKLDKIRNAF